MRKYEVVVIDTNAREVRRKTVEAKSFKDALGLVVHNADDYILAPPDSQGVKIYVSKANTAKVSRV
jgi:hypothetical protein